MAEFPPFQVTQVWAGNILQELPGLVAALETALYIAVDTEFPGFIFHTPPQTSPSARYRDLRRNVAAIRLLQIGFSVFCRDGIRRNWQINFRDFDLSSPSHSRWVRAVEMLERNGVDFGKTRRDGVSSAFFFGELRGRLDWTGLRGRRPIWVTFQGMYDTGYILSKLMPAPLPESLPEFAGLAGRLMGKILDLRVVADSCGEAPAGLRRMAENFGVTRAGEVTLHQAGAHSVLTGRIFSRMSVRLRLLDRVEEFAGLLHGIEGVRILAFTPPPFPTYPAWLLVPPVRPIPIRRWWYFPGHAQPGRRNKN